ncbi:flagellar assembly protein FliH [Caldanaerovirga acetigignens]|uniref:Flagellar assembly protein FliH n=1 Tax=Caldanaerovirga acetigignens TaxID=447595 RepID=A0A1M7G2N9_9FIRM|nr:FliH/SctL family protein [Caldanaerovirga acetigignens]SHM10510.1 flagellar assembly protein FliH [Caldanaerovirga acetigignens]
MSKVLKGVEVSRETPYKIKDLHFRTLKTENTIKDRVCFSLEAFYKSKASKLIDDAAQKASEIIEKAKEESKAIIKEAMEKQEKIEKEAFEKGYEDGFRKGKEDAERKVRTLFEKYLEQFNGLRENLLNQNKEYLNVMEKECLKLAFYIAEKILMEHAKVDSRYILGIVKSAFEKIGQEKDVLVRISEKDFQRLEGEIKEISQMARQRKVNFVMDPTLSDGECIILGNCFEIDAGLRTQLENLRAELVEMEVLYE